MKIATLHGQVHRHDMQFYERVWGAGELELLETLMAADHDQRDVVWQPDTSGGGRERMAEGIAAWRRRCPGLAFRVHSAMPDAAGQRVAVEWEATGGADVDASSGSDGSGGSGVPDNGTFCGATVLQFDAAGAIAQSRVYRQAPAAERERHVFAALRGEQRG